MSVKAMAWAWDMAEAYELDIYQAMVLLRLADHANDQGSCWPGKDTLASKCRCSLRKVDVVIHQLASMDLLRVEHRSSGGRSMTNIYELNLNQMPLPRAKTDENPAQCAPPHSVHPRTAEQETPHTTTINPAQCAPEPSYNHKRTVKPARARAAAAEFDYSNWKPDEPCVNRIRASDPDITSTFVERERLDFLTFAEDNKLPERLMRTRFQSQVHRHWIAAKKRETNTGPLRSAPSMDLQKVPTDQLDAWSKIRGGPASYPGESPDEYRARIDKHLKNVTNRESDDATNTFNRIAESLTIN